MTAKQIKVLETVTALSKKHNTPVTAKKIGMEMGFPYAKAIKSCESALEYLVDNNYIQKTNEEKYYVNEETI